MDQQKIGVFDSGIGGLTVARALKDLEIYDELIYYGDIAHLPYGDKSEAAIQAYSLKITKFLVEQGCQTLVIACNSASASATDLIKEYFEGTTRVINVIDPMVEYVSKTYHNQTIGVIGTKRTINSEIYPNKITQGNDSLKILSHATPLFVPLIEEDRFSNELKNNIIREYLHEEKLLNLDALILGCTHYPLLKNELQQYFGDQVDILDSSKIVANYALEQDVSSSGKITKCSFFVSDFTPAFEEAAKKFFGDSIHLERMPLFNTY